MGWKHKIIRQAHEIFHLIRPVDVNDRGIRFDRLRDGGRQRIEGRFKTANQHEPERWIMPLQPDKYIYQFYNSLISHQPAGCKAGM